MNKRNCRLFIFILHRSTYTRLNIFNSFYNKYRSKMLGNYRKTIVCIAISYHQCCMYLLKWDGKLSKNKQHLSNWDMVCFLDKKNMFFVLSGICLLKIILRQSKKKKLYNTDKFSDLVHLLSFFLDE